MTTWKNRLEWLAGEVQEEQPVRVTPHIILQNVNLLSSSESDLLAGVAECKKKNYAVANCIIEFRVRSWKQGKF